jgi:hypothetical protein
MLLPQARIARTVLIEHGRGLERVEGPTTILRLGILFPAAACGLEKQHRRNGCP